MSCKDCKHSRPLVNRKKSNRVGCIYATEREHYEERLIHKGLDVKHEMIYPDRDTVRMMGVTVSADDTCPLENFENRRGFNESSSIFAEFPDD